jgi:hypothetical protein
MVCQVKFTEILGYFVLDRSLQQLPRSFAQELFQIAFRFDFYSLLERGHINVRSGCIISFRLLGEGAVGFFFY